MPDSRLLPVSGTIRMPPGITVADVTVTYLGVLRGGGLVSGGTLKAQAGADGVPRVNGAALQLQVAFPGDRVDQHPFAKVGVSYRGGARGYEFLVDLVVEAGAASVPLDRVSSGSEVMSPAQVQTVQELIADLGTAKEEARAAAQKVTTAQLDLSRERKKVEQTLADTAQSRHDIEQRFAGLAWQNISGGAVDGDPASLALVDAQNRVATYWRPDGVMVMPAGLEAGGMQLSSEPLGYINGVPVAAVLAADEQGRVALFAALDGRIYAPGGIAGATDDSAAPAGQLALWAAGDSLTEGAGVHWMEPQRTTVGQLATRLGIPYHIEGVSGSDSTSIAARAEGIPILVSVQGDQIPASGPVQVVDINVRFLNGAYSRDRAGVLAGVPGTIRWDHDSDTYTFTRTAAGQVVKIPPRQQFRLDTEGLYLDWILVIQPGRNNYSQTSTIIRDTWAAVRALSEPRRYVVIGVMNGQGEGIGTQAYQQITATNDALAAEFGRHFLDPNPSQWHGRADRTPDPAYLSDNIHRTETGGYRVLSLDLEAKLKELNYV